MTLQEYLSPEFIYKLSILMDTGVVDHTVYYPWADALIAALDTPPAWLLELSVEKNTGPAVRVLREQVITPHRQELENFNFKDFYGGAYYHQVESGELGWGDFLLQAGICADGPEAAISPHEFYQQLEKYHSSKDKDTTQKEQRQWLEKSIPQAMKEVKETLAQLQALTHENKA